MFFGASALRRKLLKKFYVVPEHKEFTAELGCNFLLLLCVTPYFVACHEDHLSCACFFAGVVYLLHRLRGVFWFRPLGKTNEYTDAHSNE